MKPHIFHPEADQEYAEAALYYKDLGSDLGAHFFDEIERLILDIRAEPERWRMFDPPCRRRLSSMFPYAIIYVNQPDRVWILAVMHLHRHPDYWKHRLQ